MNTGKLKLLGLFWLGAISLAMLTVSSWSARILKAKPDRTDAISPAVLLISSPQVDEGPRGSKSENAEGTDKPDQELVTVDQFLDVFRGDMNQFESFMAEIEKKWDEAYVPMLLEVARFFPQKPRARVVETLEKKTSQKFGNDFDQWWRWHWGEAGEAHPEYAEFKARFYSKLDPRFVEYFEETEDAKIRLDEIRWGGVKRDGIPPLKDPEMLDANDADYLADSDVVFGVDLNGDARAYPKRILAWHEMFKDTIGGESVCGVY